MYVLLVILLNYLFVCKCIYIDNDRLELLEREVASLRGQAHQSSTSSEEHDLNRTFTTKKPPASQPVSARVISPSRIPLPATPRKSTNDDTINVPASVVPITRPSPPVPLVRSKTFHNETSQSSSNNSDEASLLRSYKVHLEQVLHKDLPTYSDIKIPNYSCIEDVMKANEVFIHVYMSYDKNNTALFSNFWLKMIDFDQN